MGKIEQITIELVREDGGTFAWEWNAFGEGRRLFGGSAGSLAACLDSMRAYLRDEGIVAEMSQKRFT